MNTSNTFIVPKLARPINSQVDINVAVMASGEGSNFENLVKHFHLQHKSRIRIKLLIVNKPQANAINRARNLGIKSTLLDNSLYLTRECHEKEIIKLCTENKIDLLVMAGWMRVATDVLINSYKDRIINVHPSLLPSFPGTASVEQAINSGVKITGATVHIVTNKVDNGPILAQGAVEINQTDTKQTLLNKIQEIEHLILPIGLNLLAKEWIRIKDRNY
tara:strand:+ start:1785 stop:2441 length:657 start_codon:yes stop_codon:yes gene_type:complete